MIDVVSRGIERLPYHLRSKPGWVKMVTILLTPLQAWYDSMDQVRLDCDLRNAEGVNLEQYGSVLGEARNGLSDAEYRGLLKARILVNHSTGKPETLIEILSRLTSGRHPQLQEAYPGHLIFGYDVLVPLSAAVRARVRRLLEAAVPAGVAIDSITEGPMPLPFAFLEYPFESDGFDSGVLSEEY